VAQIVELHVIYPLFVSDSKENGMFSTFKKKKIFEILNFMKICQIGTELFHADGRDTTQKTVVFRSSANTLKHRNYVIPENQNKEIIIAAMIISCKLVQLKLTQFIMNKVKVAFSF